MEAYCAMKARAFSPANSSLGVFTDTDHVGVGEFVLRTKRLKVIVNKITEITKEKITILVFNEDRYYIHVFIDNVLVIDVDSFAKLEVFIFSYYLACEAASVRQLLKNMGLTKSMLDETSTAKEQQNAEQEAIDKGTLFYKSGDPLENEEHQPVQVDKSEPNTHLGDLQIALYKLNKEFNLRFYMKQHNGGQYQIFDSGKLMTSSSNLELLTAWVDGFFQALNYKTPDNMEPEPPVEMADKELLADANKAFNSIGVTVEFDHTVPEMPFTLIFKGKGETTRVQFATFKEASWYIYGGCHYKELAARDVTSEAMIEGGAAALHEIIVGDRAHSDAMANQLNESQEVLCIKILDLETKIKNKYSLRLQCFIKPDRNEVRIYWGPYSETTDFAGAAKYLEKLLENLDSRPI